MTSSTAESVLSVIDGCVRITVRDKALNKAIVSVDMAPDRADELASGLIKVAAVARRDGVRQ